MTEYIVEGFDRINGWRHAYGRHAIGRCRGYVEGVRCCSRAPRLRLVKMVDGQRAGVVEEWGAR